MTPKGLVTYKAPALNNKTGEIIETEKTGKVMKLYVGNIQYKFVLQWTEHPVEGYEALVDFRSGQIIYRFPSVQTFYSDAKTIAKMGLNAVIEKNGVERVKKVIDNAPNLNENQD